MLFKSVNLKWWGWWNCHLGSDRKLYLDSFCCFFLMARNHEAAGYSHKTFPNNTHATVLGKGLRKHTYFTLWCSLFTHLCIATTAHRKILMLLKKITQVLTYCCCVISLKDFILRPTCLKSWRINTLHLVRDWFLFSLHTWLLIPDTAPLIITCPWDFKGNFGYHSYWFIFKQLLPLSHSSMKAGSHSSSFLLFFTLFSSSSSENVCGSFAFLEINKFIFKENKLWSNYSWGVVVSPILNILSVFTISTVMSEKTKNNWRNKILAQFLYVVGEVGPVMKLIVESIGVLLQTMLDLPSIALHSFDKLMDGLPWNLVLISTVYISQRINCKNNCKNSPLIFFLPNNRILWHPYQQHQLYFVVSSLLLLTQVQGAVAVCWLEYLKWASTSVLAAQNLWPCKFHVLNDCKKKKTGCLVVLFFLLLTVYLIAECVVHPLSMFKCSAVCLHKNDFCVPVNGQNGLTSNVFRRNNLLELRTTIFTSTKNH